MRIAVLSDVHGNLPALEAVLVELEREAPALVVVCGDVASGPLPAETIDLLMTLSGARFVRGNADRGLVSAFDDAERPDWPGPAADWCAAQISARQRDFLASFEDTVLVEHEQLGGVLFCHGSPSSDEEIMSAATPLERMRELVGGVEADLVVCGHTHMQFDRRVDGVRVVNPGSVGMPYGEPGAYWALLDASARNTGPFEPCLGPDPGQAPDRSQSAGHVEFRRVDYDRESAAARIRVSAWPDAAEFARENLLSVPTVDEALAFFAVHGGP